jgi:hypothetical protein
MRFAGASGGKYKYFDSPVSGSDKFRSGIRWLTARVAEEGGGGGVRGGDVLPIRGVRKEETREAVTDESRGMKGLTEGIQTVGAGGKGDSGAAEQQEPVV